jgi:hypothetical protein
LAVTLGVDPGSGSGKDYALLPAWQGSLILAGADLGRSISRAAPLRFGGLVLLLTRTIAGFSPLNPRALV